MTSRTEWPELSGSEIAIIGLACRLPGAATPEQFWQNLCGGVESLTWLSDEDLRRAGVPRRVYQDASYVRRMPVLEGIELFDAGFFGYTPHEARLMDPQHRLFLECAWEVLERGGYDPAAYPAPVGVFTGAKTNTYLLNLFADREIFRGLDSFDLALGNDLAAMATRVSYKLDLKGPSYAIHTACSTSLVAVHLACQSLLIDECRMAIAGGAAINVPQTKGYRHQPGGILSPDGSCRTFDARAAGSNFGNGVGAVLLKRLEDALADGDHVHALIKGTATNNDGAAKASFTAPGVEGQARVILEALACAGVDAESISYLEAHGTATDLGDSIEILALKEAFSAGTERRGFCALGSVKTNVGHLETAAGVAGLIKTALALEHRTLPPSLNFERPNPKLELEQSPFYVNTELRPWPAGELPRRAGLSSFGIGSTNVHAVLEEAPPAIAGSSSRSAQVLLLSARTETALAAATDRLAEHLRQQPKLPLADVAFTLAVGRRRFSHRQAVVARSTAEAAEALRERGRSRLTSLVDEAAERPVAFLLPGLGDHRLDLARDLYEEEPTFRELLDRCAGLLESQLGEDFRRVLYPEGGARPRERAADNFRALLGRQGTAGDAASLRLDETWLAQPVLFAVEVALAGLWREWGIEPQALLGYSLGEYVAAHLAGVLSLEDALRLVAWRARKIQELPAGAMSAVSLAAAQLTPRLGEGVFLAAINGPNLSVVAGEPAAVTAFEAELAATGTAYRRLATTHAFHTPSMAPVADALEHFLRTLTLSPPRVAYLSNVTGDWIKLEEATDPRYWVRHLCEPVRFAQGAARLLENDRFALLELGTGQSLASFVKLHPACGEAQAARVFPALPGALSTLGDLEAAQAAMGGLWASGARIDWRGYYQRERRLRVPLPTYAFERQRHWIDGVAAMVAAEGEGPRRGEKKAEVGEWFYTPAWRRQPLPPASAPAAGAWLLLADRLGLADEMARLLKAAGRTVTMVLPGETFGRLGEGRYQVSAGAAGQWDELLRDLEARGQAPAVVVHLWGVEDAEPCTAPARRAALETGFFTLLELLRSLGRRAAPVRVGLVATGLERRQGHEGPYLEDVCPEKTTALGLIKVAPQEINSIATRGVGVSAADEPTALAARLVAEFSTEADDRACAWRGAERWVEAFEPVRIDAPGPAEIPLRERGVYLVTGGLGGVGRVIAAYLARRWQARLILTRRTALPARPAWSDWLENHEPDEPTSRLLRDLLAIEAAGGEVEVVVADVTDREAMQAAVAAGRLRFGELDGAFHAAGVGSGGLMLLKSAEQMRAVLAPKLEGLRVLEEVLAGEPIEFLALFSSLQSVLGDFGQSDYCGANIFLDAVAEAAEGKAGPRVLSIGWDNWQEVGIAVETELPPHMKEWQAELLSRAITNDEGPLVLERALAARRSRLVVTTQDLETRLAESRFYTGERILAEFGTSAPPPRSPSAAGAGTMPARSELEARIAGIWQRVLGRERVGLADNFFDLGGNSLIGMQLINEISRDLGTPIPPVTLFEAPTVAALVARLAPEEVAQAPRAAAAKAPALEDVAIVGMAGRFPGAMSVDELWRNLCAGLDATTWFSDDELLAAGVRRETLERPNYVRARPILEGVELFDAELFGYSPREAEIMDPQQRLFLECAWEALETAACDPEQTPGRIGVFAGCAISTYLLNLHSHPELMESVGTFQTMIGNEKDSLPTRVSYKLNLTGPSLAIQTFCSTSLVAVHMARRALLDGECEVAVAGGASIHLPQTSGYHYQDGGFVSSSGQVRAFDAGADGFVFGNGLAAVVLKRLSDALADGDPIRAVIKGSAINNDGSLKVGYTATSVEGQATVVAEALAAAGIDAESIGYVEAHGTGTALGDPVEITALTKAYRRSTEARGYCPIGSIKSNIGHLDRAAGVTGLVKAVMVLERETIPPSLYFERPNPQIDFAGSPFYVNTELRPWPRNGAPRRAAVNSLGLGGTNAHVLLEEAPRLEASGPSPAWQLLALSAQTPASLEEATERLRRHLDEHPTESLADVAHTLRIGRRSLRHRRFLVCRDREDALAGLGAESSRRCFTTLCSETGRRPILLFPGLGGQFVGMARGLYEGEATFRAELDRCAELLLPELGLDLREILYPAVTSGDGTSPAPGLDLRRMVRRGGAEEEDPAEARLRQTRLLQPVLFVVEYALAKLWESWGVRPQALLGYSLGEYVAACLAGVLELPDALRLVARRARLIEDLPGGAMLAVALTEPAVLQRLPLGLSLAAVNGPEQTVVAGPSAAVEAFATELAAEGVASRGLQVSHAFHSAEMRPLFEPLVELVRGFNLAPPRVPVLSNVTGTWLSASDATDPTYWARHTCQPVRFSQALDALAREGGQVLLEVGPQALSSLVLQHPTGQQPGSQVVASLRHAFETREDRAQLLDALGKLWASGVVCDARAVVAGERRRRVVLPTYAFERRRYWVERADLASATTAPALAEAGSPATGWLYAPGWRRFDAAAPLAADALGGHQVWWIGEPNPLGEELARIFAGAGAAVAGLAPGESLVELGDRRFIVDPRRQEDLRAVLALTGPPSLVLDLTGLEGTGLEDTGLAAPIQASPSAMGRLFGEADAPRVMWWTVGCELFGVTGGEKVAWQDVGRVGAAAVVERDVPGLSCHAIDFERAALVDPATIAARLATEIATASLGVRGVGEPPRMVALRGHRHRWLPSLEPLREGRPEVSPEPGGAVLLLNGLGSLGFGFAERLAGPGARLALLEAGGFPARDQWQEWLANDATHGLVSHKIERVQALEAAGARVLVAGVEANRRDELGRFLAEVETGLGPLRGVVGSFEPEGHDGDAVLAGRLAALRELAEALGGVPLEFGLLVSATSFPDQPGGASDGALALCLDGFVAAHGSPWTSLTWDLGSTAAGADARQRAALDRLWQHLSCENLVAAAEPLPPGWTKLDGLARQHAAKHAEPAAPAVSLYARPGLRVEFVAPRDPAEEAIAAIWRELLGVADVGVHDNFLDLGGDSLLATRLISRMRDVFHLDLPVRLFFEASTIEELARAVVAKRAVLEEAEMAELLSMLDNLSEDEIDAELAKRRPLAAQEA